MAMNLNQLPSDEQGMLNTMMAAQKNAEKFSLASQLATLRHNTIQEMIRNIK